MADGEKSATVRHEHAAAPTRPEPRSAATRKADVLAKLTAPPVDAWVATTGPYLVPLTSAWLRERIVLATDGRSRTAVNLTTTGTARIAVGSTPGRRPPSPGPASPALVGNAGGARQARGSPPEAGLVGAGCPVLVAVQLANRLSAS